MIRIDGKYYARDFSCTIGSVTLGVMTGFQFAFTPDIIMGIEAGYTYSFGSESIALQYPGEEKSNTYKKDDLEVYWNSAKIDDINFSGVRLGLNFSYSFGAF